MSSLRRISLRATADVITKQLTNIQIQTAEKYEKSNVILTKLCATQSFKELRDYIQHVVPLEICIDLFAHFSTLSRIYITKHQFKAALVLFIRKGFKSFDKSVISNWSAFQEVFGKPNCPFMNIRLPLFLQLAAKSGTSVTVLTLHCWYILNHLELFRTAVENMPELQELNICKYYDKLAAKHVKRTEQAAVQIISTTCKKLQNFRFDCSSFDCKADWLIFSDYPINTERSPICDSLVKIDLFRDDSDWTILFRENFTNFVVLLQNCPNLKSFGGTHLCPGVLGAYSLQQLRNGVKDPKTNLIHVYGILLTSYDMMTIMNMCPKLSSLNLLLPTIDCCEKLTNFTATITKLQLIAENGDVLYKCLEACGITLTDFTFGWQSTVYKCPEALNFSVLFSLCPNLQKFRCDTSCIVATDSTSFRSLKYLCLTNHSNSCVFSASTFIDILQNSTNIEELCLLLPSKDIEQINNEACNIVGELTQLRKVLLRTPQNIFQDFISKCPNLNYLVEGFEV